MSDWTRPGNVVLPLLRRHLPSAGQFRQRSCPARLQALPKGRTGDLYPSPAPRRTRPHRSEDPHFIGDRQRLEQKIRAELGDMLDEPPAAGGGEPGQFQVLAQQAQAPAPVAALADQPLDQDEGHAAIPVLAAPVQGDNAASQASSHPQSSAQQHNQQQPQLPLGGGGNDQAPDTLDATLEERRQKVKEVGGSHLIA